MADDPLFALTTSLIAGRFAVDPAQMLLDGGGGIPSFVARDRLAADGKRIALSVSRDASPRARALRLLVDPIDNLMVPLGHGVGPMPGGKGESYYIICSPPPGPPVSAALNPWPERVLMDLVLRPMARVLDTLHGLKLTHRAIRPNNVFQGAPGQQVTLGAAWAAPAAMHQPAVFEPPDSAMCHPAGRGEGTIADDVYSLGVLILTLIGGKIPMANMDDATIIRWKLDLGSFAALTRDIPVAGSFAELLRGMLAEDPEHRPLPSQLRDPASLRGRRVAARPPRRSQRPFMFNEIGVFDARMLAYALLSDMKKAVQLLRNGLVTQWLRRELGDAGIAAQIEDLVRGRVVDTKSGLQGDALLVMHTIAAISPRMPLCWRGIALWPDGLSALLAEGVVGRSDLAEAAEELLINDIVSTWSPANSRHDRHDSPDITPHLSQVGGQGTLLRIFYGLNPLLPCRSPAAATGWIATLPALMQCLEGAAPKAGDSLIDLHLSAFIASRGDRKVERRVRNLISANDADDFRMAEINLLRELQIKHHPAPMPELAQWVAARLRPDLDRWRNKLRRQEMQERLEALAQAGLLARLIELTTDTTARAQDSAGAQRAAYELTKIDSELSAMDTNDQVRFAHAERYGQAMSSGLGLSTFILVVMSVLLR